jgi:hypothetical protein
MEGRFDLSYLYARLCGYLRSSWLGPRSSDLLRAGKLPELWRLLFEDSVPALPEKQLVSALESRVLARSMESFVELASSLEGADDFVLALRRKREFARVKRILLALRDHEAECPPSEDPGLADDFDVTAWPRVGEMFPRGRFSWIDESALLDLPASENRLDRQYYGEVWSAMGALCAEKRAGVERLFLLEVELQNILWALRLSFYYGLRPEDIKPKLIALPGKDTTKRALASLGRSPQRRNDWQGWPYEGLLNGGTEAWRLDLPALEKKMKVLLCKRARLVLHLNSSSFAPLYAWFILKEAEAALILGVAEGLTMEVPPEELSSFVQAWRIA